MSLFGASSLAAWLLIAVAAFVVRGKPFAVFVSILIGIYTFASTSIAIAIRPTFFWIPFVVVHGTVYLHLLMLTRPRMRPWWYRAVISVPASFLVAAAVLSVPWGILLRLGFHPWGTWLPFVIALIGVWQSLSARREHVHLVLDEIDVPTLARHRAPLGQSERPLKVVQITDPHLGPFMSVERLRRICERAVTADPDLIVLTGDFLTMESQEHARHLTEALSPLRAMAGRTFACHGNHDHEAPEIVAHALRENGVRLLVDEAVVANTPYGDVEVLGLDYVFRRRAEHALRVANEHPRRPGLLRLLLLHDPGAWKHVPPGTADLTLSGHTHGGHIGFVSLGGTWTVPRMVDMPDHGFWARRRDRLYVHRGTGHYGFPLRLGVPAEESVIFVHSSRS